MASTFRAIDTGDSSSNMVRMAEDRPLNPEENFTLELMRRRIVSGYFDDSGRYFRPSTNEAGATAQPQRAESATTLSAVTGSGAVISGSGFIAPALTLTRVQPGDLITAGFANGLIDALLILDDRLRDLEARSGTVVTPTAPAVPVTPTAPTAPTVPVTPTTTLPQITSAIFALEDTGRGTVLVRGRNLSGVKRVDLDGVRARVSNLTARPTSVGFRFTPPQGQELNGVRITVSGSDGEDSSRLRPATGKNIDTLGELFDRTPDL